MPLLSAGQQHWIMLTGGAPTTWLGWAYGIEGAAVGLVAHRSAPADPWNVYTGDRGTLRVNGELVVIPEPGTAVLLTIATAGLICVRSRGKRLLGRRRNSG